MTAVGNSALRGAVMLASDESMMARADKNNCTGHGNRTGIRACFSAKIYGRHVFLITFTA